MLIERELTSQLLVQLDELPRHGWAGIFLVLAGALGVLMVTEPTATFLMLSTVATVGLTVVGIGASVLWFVSIMRKHGLRVRFTPA